MAKIEGMKATELAALLGISVQTIYNWKEVPRGIALYLECRKELEAERLKVAALKEALRA